MLLSRTCVRLTCVDEASLLVGCRVARKSEPKATRPVSENGSRLDDLLMEGREDRKALDWLEVLGFLENIHEHLSSLFDAAGILHIFRLFVVARDVH